VLLLLGRRDPFVGAVSTFDPEVDYDAMQSFVDVGGKVRPVERVKRDSFAHYVRVMSNGRFLRFGVRSACLLVPHLIATLSDREDGSNVAAGVSKPSRGQGATSPRVADVGKVEWDRVWLSVPSELLANVDKELNGGDVDVGYG